MCDSKREREREGERERERAIEREREQFNIILCNVRTGQGWEGGLRDLWSQGI